MKKIYEVPMYSYKPNPDQASGTRTHHKAVVVGAGPVGLAAAIDLVLQGVPVVVVDDNDRVSWGSRATCYARRPMEILDRLGAAKPIDDHGVSWHVGKIFNDNRQIYEFDLEAEEGGSKFPPFVNLQQYYLEEYLVKRVFELQEQGLPIEIRGGNKVVAIRPEKEFVDVRIETPDGMYEVRTDWLIACDGAGSPVRTMLGLDFIGRTFFDHFLICDIIMNKDFPAERWFWFDPPFNRGESSLMHKQADNVWRVEFQLGFNTDKDEEVKPENVIPRIQAMLGPDVEFEIEWVSAYTFQCRRLAHFKHGHILFAGDAGHQVAPFDARGVNSGFEDTDNMIWKLKLVMDGKAPESLLDSYDFERVMGADENLTVSTRSADFVTPKTEATRQFRDAVLNMAGKYPFVRPLVNSGRMAAPCTYTGSVLNGADVDTLPALTRPGSPSPDAPITAGWLADHTGNKFKLISFDVDIPDTLDVGGIEVEALRLSGGESPELRERYLGDESKAVYLVRPDQYVAARWSGFDEAAVVDAVKVATGNAIGDQV